MKRFLSTNFLIKEIISVIKVDGRSRPTCCLFNLITIGLRRKIMSLKDVREGLKVVGCLIFVASFYFLVIKNEPLHDEVARTVEQSNSWTTERKLKQTDTFLFHAKNKLENAIDQVTKQVFQLNSSGTLLSSKLKASIAREEMLDKKLADSKWQFKTLEQKASDNPPSYDIAMDITTVKNKITKMLLEKKQLKATIVSLKNQLDENINQTQKSGLTLIKLEGDLSLVSNTNDLNNIFSPSGGIGLSKSGADELAELISDVGTINKQLKESQDNNVVPDYMIDAYKDTDALFDSFINSDDTKTINIGG